MDLTRALAPRHTAHAHCDIPCGVYDPAQARIEAESCYRIIEKYHASSDEVFRARCLVVKEERAELAKHHIDVLWSDYFKPEHLEKYRTSDVARRPPSEPRWSNGPSTSRRPEAAGAHRHARRVLEGHQRPGRDPAALRLRPDGPMIRGGVPGAAVRSRPDVPLTPCASD
jgi:hypothetical protein